MSSSSTLALACLTASVAALLTLANAAGDGAGDRRRIDAAMRAAPEHVARRAAVAVMERDGAMRTLRPGGNGFTCVPDNPVTHGPDPMCMDAAALAWARAWLTGKTPPAGRAGLVYMLAGEAGPHATAPGAHHRRAKTRPRVMIVGADAAFYGMYPKDAGAGTAAPQVALAGTPYQHLVVPLE